MRFSVKIYTFKDIQKKKKKNSSDRKQTLFPPNLLFTRLRPYDPDWLAIQKLFSRDGFGTHKKYNVYFIFITEFEATV